MRLIECQADTYTNPVHWTTVLPTIIFFVFCIIVVLRRLYMRPPRSARNPDLNVVNSSDKHHLDRPNGASVARNVAGLFAPTAGPPTVQFASEAQPLLTPPSDVGGLGPIAGLQYDSSSLSQHDNHETPLEWQYTNPDHGDSDGPDALHNSDLDTHSLAIIQYPAPRVDGCSTTTDADSVHSNAGLVTSDEADNDDNTVSGVALLSDEGLAMAADEEGNAPSYTPLADAGSGSASMYFHDGDVEAKANEVADGLSDKHSVSEADDELSDIHSANEVDGELPNTPSISGLSDTSSSWITTDAESGDDCLHSDIESDSDAWVTTDESGPEDSDLGSPVTSNEGLLSAGSCAHSESLRGIPSEDSGSRLNSFALSSRANSRLAQLGSPALSELAEGICARLLGYADSDSVADATPQVMPPSATTSSINSASYREWTPAAPGFVFSVGAPVPSTSSPTASTSQLVPAHPQCSHSQSRVVLRDSHDERTLEASHSSSSGSSVGEGSGVRGPFTQQSVEATESSSSSSAFLDRLARLAQTRPDEYAVGSIATREEAPGALFSSHRRLVTV